MASASSPTHNRGGEPSRGIESGFRTASSKSTGTSETQVKHRTTGVPALRDFLVDRRNEIIARTRAKNTRPEAPIPTAAEPTNGIPSFLTQLVEVLRAPAEFDDESIRASAARHGESLLRMGLSVGQVVHNYGALCQTITEVAVEDDFAISSGDFRILNACLDNAIACAVSEFSRQREQSVSDVGVKRLGVLVHELRNALNAATMAFDALTEDAVEPIGDTASILARSLVRMRDLVDRTLAEVRLQHASQSPTHLSLAGLIQDLALEARIEARQRGLRLTVDPVEGDVFIDADPRTIFAALENLLQNAFKFTRPGGQVSLRTHTAGDRVRIDIEDECGGIPDGNVGDLFRDFGQLGSDRSGLGLGLTISRRGVEASRGEISVLDLPGKGCIFTIDLPRQL
jgi:signal transduction histidine kinase